MTEEITKDKGAKLLDKLIELGAKNDADIARRLGVSPSQICRVRNGKLDIGPTLIIYIHEEFPLSIKEIKELVSA